MCNYAVLNQALQATDICGRGPDTADSKGDVIWTAVPAFGRQNDPICHRPTADAQPIELSMLVAHLPLPAQTAELCS